MRDSKTQLDRCSKPEALRSLAASKRSKELQYQYLAADDESLSKAVLYLPGSAADLKSVAAVPTARHCPRTERLMCRVM